jgi:hypothetical protein
VLQSSLVAPALSPFEAPAASPSAPESPPVEPGLNNPPAFGEAHALAMSAALAILDHFNLRRMSRGLRRGTPERRDSVPDRRERQSPNSLRPSGTSHLNAARARQSKFGFPMFCHDGRSDQHLPARVENVPFASNSAAEIELHLEP